MHLSIAAECDTIAAVYDLADPADDGDIGTVACSVVSGATEGGGAAVKDALCGYLADAFGTGVGLFAAGATANPVIGVAVWKGVTFFANTAVCVGLADGGARNWGYNHESDHEVAVARDIIRKHDCLELTQQHAVGVSRLNWSAIPCPDGFTTHDHSPFHRPIPITYVGQIGPLQMDASTAIGIRRVLGPPEYDTTGSFDNAPSIRWELLGYGCRGRELHHRLLHQLEDRPARIVRHHIGQVRAPRRCTGQSARRSGIKTRARAH